MLVRRNVWSTRRTKTSITWHENRSTMNQSRFEREETRRSEIGCHSYGVISSKTNWHFSHFNYSFSAGLIALHHVVVAVVIGAGVQSYTNIDREAWLHDNLWSIFRQIMRCFNSNWRLLATVFRHRKLHSVEVASFVSVTKLCRRQQARCSLNSTRRRQATRIDYKKSTNTEAEEAINNPTINFETRHVRH